MFAAALGLTLIGCGKDPSPVSANRLRVNEVNPHNITWQDTWGRTGDWIELYNGGDDAIDLGGYYISDGGGGKRYKYQFDQGEPGDGAAEGDTRTIVKPHGVLLVWADGDTTKSTPLAPHVGFKLSTNGDGVWLSDQTGYLIDFVEFGAIPPNTQGTVTTSIARFPDGSGPFEWCSVASPEQLNGAHCTGQVL